MFCFKLDGKEAPLKVPLYPHQERAVKFLFSKKKSLNSTGVGSGKTIESLCFALLSGTKTVILTSSSLVLQWEEEVRKFTFLEPLVPRGDRGSRMLYYSKFFLSDVSILILSVDVFLADHPFIKRTFDTFIVDDVSGIKDPKAVLYKTLKEYIESIRNVVINTATPLVLSVLDVCTILSLLSIGELEPVFEELLFFSNGGLSSFSKKFELLEDSYEKVKEFILLDPSEAEGSFLMEGVIALEDLKIDFIPLSYTEEYRKEFLLLKNRAIQSGFNMFQSFTKAAISPSFVSSSSIVSSIKLDYIVNLISKENREKVFIYVRYLAEVEYLSRSLSHLGIPFSVLSGSFSVGERSSFIETFKNHPGCSVLVSTDVARAGLNIQDIGWLIFGDIPFSPAAVRQFIGRANRIGRSKAPLKVSFIYMNNTVEEDRVRALNSRQSHSNSFFNETFLFDIPDNPSFIWGPLNKVY